MLLLSTVDLFDRNPAWYSPNLLSIISNSLLLNIGVKIL